MRYALAKWNESTKRFLNQMRKRYDNTSDNTCNSDDDTVEKDSCALTNTDSICTSRDITFGTTRYVVYFIIIKAVITIIMIIVFSTKAKRSSSVVDSYLTDKGN